MREKWFGESSSLSRECDDFSPGNRVARITAQLDSRSTHSVEQAHLGTAPKERSTEVRVELPPAHSRQFADNVLFSERRAIGPIRRHRVDCVCQHDDSRAQWDRLT